MCFIKQLHYPEQESLFSLVTITCPEDQKIGKNWDFGVI